MTPSPPTVVDPRNINTAQIERKIKKEPPPPTIMVNDVNSYGNLYGELTNLISEEKFQVKFTNDTTAKISCNNSENYRKAINVLQNNNLNSHNCENEQSRPIRVMAKNLHHSCKSENVIKYLRDCGFKIIMADNKLSWKEKIPLNMFVLTFDNCEDIETLIK